VVVFLKKFIILLIALVILTSLAACAGGGKDNSGDTSSLENNSSDINSDEASSEDASSEESPSEESSDESSQDNGGNNLPPKELAYNIAVDKPYTAVSESYRTDSFGDAADKNGRVLRGKLTDGETAPSGNSSAIGGYGSDTLTVTIDLGERSLIYGVGTDCFGNQWGIGDPGKTVVEYLISDDGTNFDRLSSVSPSLKNATIFYVDDWKGCYYYYYPDKPVYARYVKVIYNITGEHVWSSEIFVFGIEKSFLEDKEAIPRVFIKTENNDRVHKSAYYPCELIVYDPSGRYDMISEPKGEIKIRGNSTSGGAKAPYNIRFSDKENVLGMGKAKKWYLIANMYDKTQIRNKLAFDLASQIGMAYVQESAFVEVYLNGVYRGCYLLCESIGVGETRVDIDITGNEFLFEYEPWENYSNPEWIRTPIYNILLGFNDPDYPNSTQRKYLNDFFDKAERAIATHDIEEIGKYIDIQSFVDAYIVQELFKQVDYATSSTRFYLKDGKLYEGPVWDFDLSAGNCSSSYYMDYNNVYTTGNSWEGWWCRGLWNSHLFKCKEIYEMVKERFSELQPQIINLYKDNDSGKNRIDALLDEFGDDIHKNYTVWSTSEAYSTLERIPSDGTYEGEIDYLRDWLKNRNEWLLQQFNEN
jgi:hypothetical protein